MHLADVVLPQGGVPLLVEQPGLDTRDMRGQPLSMAERYGLVSATVHQQHRDGYLGQVESPRASLGEAVVPASFDAGRVGLLHADHLLAEEARVLAGRERRPHVLGQLGGRGRQHCLALLLAPGPGRGLVREHQGGVLDHPRACSGEPVQAGRVVRGGRGQARSRGDQVGKQGRTSQQRRSAAGQAPHGQPADAQRRADRPRVGRGVGHGPSRLRSRLAVAGPVIADQPQAAGGRVGHGPAVQVP